MSGKRIAVIIVVIIAVAAAAVFAFFRLGRGGAASGSAVFVQSVSSLTAADSFAERFTGIVETQKTDKTEFDTDRTLDQLFVEEGDVVKEGDDLFSYDTESIRLEIEQLRLEIEKMEMDIGSSEQEIDSLNASLEKAESQDKPEYLATIKQLQADISQAKYDIKTKESEISRKEASIDESVVKARMGGIIESIGDAQDIIDGKSYTDDGSADNTFILIRAEGDYRVKGQTDEQSIRNIFNDMDVIVRSRIDDHTWHGRISAIDTQSADSNENSAFSSMYYSDEGENATKYAFYVELDNTDDILLGQHVIIEPDYGQGEERTGIWLSAGFIVNEDGGAWIWAAADENAPLEKRSVTLGAYDENLDEYEIISGLARQDLIAWPDSDCAEGMPVTTEYTVSEDESEMPEDPDMTDDMGQEDDTEP